jgi:hypothetical protein
MSTSEAFGQEDVEAGAAAVAEYLELWLGRQALQENQQQREDEVVQGRGLAEGSGGGGLGRGNTEALSKLYVFKVAGQEGAAGSMAAHQYQQQQGREHEEEQGSLWMVMNYEQAQVARRGEQGFGSGPWKK